MPHKLIKDLRKLKDKKQAENLQRFFKTGKGEYGEGDVFLGIKVPIQRKICKNYGDLNLNAIQKLLNSKIHEHRLCGLFVLVSKYKKSKNKKEIFKFYLKNTKKINNWDLVDLSSPNIVGEYLLNKDKKVLYKLAKSKNLWEKRISIVSTFTFIRNNKLEDTLKISQILLKDKHDLIHKAVGWMLREVGKKDIKKLELFIQKNYKDMPRTMLRYAIEKFPEKKRKDYLKGKW
jgi:3-methyladenine DNA glycosylase AlkD